MKNRAVELAREVLATYGAKKPPIRASQTKGRGKHPSRRLTVGESWNTGFPVPFLRLKGKWMQQAGFSPGVGVEVRVKEGELIVRRKNDGDYGY